MAADTRTGGREATTAIDPGRYALSVGRPDRPTPPGWEWTRLTQVARLETGHTPSRKHPEYWGDDVPWIGIKDATRNDGRRIDDTLQKTTSAGIENSSARLLPRNTVCLSRTASVGYVVVMGRDMATSQDFVNWVCHPDALDWRFLKWVLLAEREALRRWSHGTTHQTIYFPEVKAFHICLPRRHEQRAIADVLGVLDDKIESNRRAAGLLESIVRLAHERAVTGAITWEPLAALGSVSGGGTPSSKVPDYWDPSEVPWITPRDMTALDGSPVVWAGERSISPAGLAASSARLLEAGTVLYTSRATLGLVAIAQQPLATNQGFISITPTPPFSSAFVYATLRARTEHINAKANGSTFQEVNKTNFKTVRFARPSNDVLRAFDVVATSALRLVAGLVREESNLRRIRDALLPKLVSGQIRVPLSDDVEEQIAAATGAPA